MARVRSTSLFNSANLVALYEFDSGALTTDTSGNNNTLTNNGTVTGDTTGQKYGTGAADFGSSNTTKYFSLASNLGIDGGAITEVCWFKLATENQTQYLIDQRSSTSKVGYFLEYDYNGGAGAQRILAKRLQNGVSEVVASYTVGSLGTSAWYHAGLTYDNTNLRLYFSGTLRDTQAASGTGSTALTDGLEIGDRQGSPGFSGEIDDAAIFNAAISDADMLNLASDPGTTTSTSTSSTTTSSSTSTTQSTSTSLSTSTTRSTSTTQSTSTSTSLSTSTTTTLPNEQGYLFDGTLVSNSIQQFVSTGFQVGTHARVNTDGVTYYYFAFKKQVDFFDIGTYTGNGINNRHIGTIFQEALVMVQKTSGTSQAPVYMPLSSSAISTTLNFSNIAALTTAIIQIETPGFMIGTHASVNTDTATYTYFIWKNPSQSNFTRKYYEYRVYKNNVYNTSWTNEVLTQPSFRNVINGGPGEVIVRLDRSFDDFGENDDITLNNRVDIWVYDREYPNGQRLYRGFISGYKPVLDGNKEYLEITILSYIFELSYYMLRDGTGATTIAYNSQDPSAILQDIILKYRADGGSINYTATSIQTTGTTVSYTFNSNTVREAIDKVIELAPYGWYWTVDANSIIYLKPKSTTAIHNFVIGTHINRMETWRRIEDVVNRVYFTGFTTISGTGMYRIYSNTGSISSYGLHAIHKVDGRVTNTSTADTMSNRILTAKVDPEIRTGLTIVDNNGENKFRGYDIESIIPGDTMKIGNIKQATKTTSRWDQASWDTDVWDATLSFTAADVIQILSLDYTPDSLMIEASSRLPEISKRIEDIDRNLTASITLNNPISPT